MVRDNNFSWWMLRDSLADTFLMCRCAATVTISPRWRLQNLLGCRTPSFSSLNIPRQKLKPAKAGLNFWWMLRDSLGIPACVQNVTISVRCASKIYLFSNSFVLVSKYPYTKIKTGKSRFEFLVDVKRLELLTLSV